MLGAINGNHVNLSAINSEGALTIVLAATSIMQAGATASSAAASAIAAASTPAQAAQNLASALVAAIASASTQAQPANALTIEAAALGGASLIYANGTQGDTLLAIYFPVLVRKSVGSDLAAHGAGSSLTPHSRGNPVTVH